jgi:hypothetical protein
MAEEIAQRFGAWSLVRFSDRTEKRALCKCDACGKIVELSVEALEGGAVPFCPGCLTPRFALSPANQSRSFARDLAKEAVWGAKQRHRRGGAA